MPPLSGRQGPLKEVDISINNSSSLSSQACQKHPRILHSCEWNVLFVATWAWSVLFAEARLNIQRSFTHYQPHASKDTNVNYICLRIFCATAIFQVSGMSTQCMFAVEHSFLLSRCLPPFRYQSLVRSQYGLLGGVLWSWSAAQRCETQL